MKEGRGVLYYKNGDKKMGEYKNDKPIGNHVMISKNGKTKNINYEI